MKCNNCGADLTDDTVFCSYCGVKLEQKSDNDKLLSDTNAVADDIKQVSNDFQSEEIKMQSHSMGSKIKQDTSVVSNEGLYTYRAKKILSDFWHGLDLFCKIATISIIVIILLLLISFGNGKSLSILLSIIQLAGIIAALLIHKNTIKLNRSWIKYIVLGVSILLTFANMMSFSSVKKNENKSTKKENTNTTQMEEQVNLSVNSPYGYDDCVDRDYSTIANDFELAGFTNIRSESVEDLSTSESDRINTIESVSINGHIDFTKNQEFNKGDEVIIRYHVYKKCNVKINIDFVPNLIFSKYNVKVWLDENIQDTLSHGMDKTFDFSVDPGEHTISFESEDSSTVKGKVSLMVDCDLEAEYKIYCHSDDISIETIYVDRLTELSEDEIKMDVPASDYNYKNYKEAEDSLKTLGFTNIEFNVLYDIVFGVTTEGSVDSISINGNNDFNRGDVFPKDASVIITYHMKEGSNPDKPIESIITSATAEESNTVPYSNNDRETAKNGDTGVFSYKSSGMAYDIYWIIDFDEGYVYYFTDGNGEETCDRLKIDSGTLNDRVVITYHDGADEWSYSLHFHYVNHPETLIMVDNDGFEYKYNGTDLDKALRKRDTKTIKDY